MSLGLQGLQKTPRVSLLLPSSDKYFPCEALLTFRLTLYTSFTSLCFRSPLSFFLIESWPIPVPISVPLKRYGGVFKCTSYYHYTNVHQFYWHHGINFNKTFQKKNRKRYTTETFLRNCKNIDSVICERPIIAIVSKLH